MNGRQGMKPNLKDVKLPKMWGDINADKQHYAWKPKPTIEISEVSRIIINWRKWVLRYRRGVDAVRVERDAKELRRRFNLRGRAR